MKQNGKTIIEKKYYSNRLHFRGGFGPIEYDSIFHMGLIKHQYMIDCWIKTEENRLFYLSTHQKQMRSEYQVMFTQLIKLFQYDTV